MAPQLGVISDSAFQRHMLQSALSSNGADIVVSCEPDQFKDQREERTGNVECWIVELEDEAQDIRDILNGLDETGVPVLFGLGIAPNRQEIEYVSWQRRLLSKLEEALGTIGAVENAESISKIIETNASPETARFMPASAEVEARQPVSDEVWVLAASLGGPGAVKELIDRLPADIGLGFLYAQHVDAHFSKVLTDVLGRHSALRLKPMISGEPLRNGDVQVVPVDRQVRFSEQGCILDQSEWPGPYGPSIDQLLANVFDYYGNRCHVIVFSGMGNDGAMTIPRMAKAGCNIWTQSPECCANYSMPQSIIDLGCSQFSGKPAELAEKLIRHARHEGLL